MQANPPNGSASVLPLQCLDLCPIQHSDVPIMKSDDQSGSLFEFLRGVNSTGKISCGDHGTMVFKENGRIAAIQLAYQLPHCRITWPHIRQAPDPANTHHNVGRQGRNAVVGGQRR